MLIMFEINNHLNKVLYLLKVTFPLLKYLYKYHIIRKTGV